MNSYLDHKNVILDIHASYKKVSKYKLRFKSKPWITLALRNLYLLKTLFLKNS